MKLIIEIDNEAYKGLVTEGHIFVKHIFNAVKNGTPISDNATNGDVIKMMFPNIEVEEQSKDLFIVFNMDFQGTPFYKAWWNAPYTKGGK